MKDPLRFDARAETKRITSFIQKTVKEAGALGVVVGLSGGVDSAVVGALCVRALGKEKVLAVMLPSQFTPPRDLDDAEALASGWGVVVRRANIAPVVDAIFSGMSLDADRIAKANVQARVRMTMIYYLSNASKLLVAGTGDRSEVQLGFYTKFGDGGVDFLPIAHLYKTQVRALAKHLGSPAEVATKPSSPALWAGHTAADELPEDYDRLDPLLYYIFERKLTPLQAAKKVGVDPNVAKEVMEMHKGSAHKRALPPSLL